MVPRPVRNDRILFTERKLMWSACHKKRYLLCAELTNFGIFTKPFPIFFSKQAKLRQPHRAETADFRFQISNFEIRQIAFLMTCRPNKIRKTKCGKNGRQTRSCLDAYLWASLCLFAHPKRPLLLLQLAGSGWEDSELNLECSCFKIVPNFNDGL